MSRVKLPAYKKIIAFAVRFYGATNILENEEKCKISLVRVYGLRRNIYVEMNREVLWQVLKKCRLGERSHWHRVFFVKKAERV